MDHNSRSVSAVYLCSLCGILFAVLGLDESDEVPQRRLCPNCFRLPPPPSEDPQGAG